MDQGFAHVPCLSIHNKKTIYWIEMPIQTTKQCNTSLQILLLHMYINKAYFHTNVDDLEQTRVAH